MSKTDQDDTDMLDALFAEARGAAPEPSADLLARVLGDAEAAQDSWSAAAPAPEPRPVSRRSVLAVLREALGGWPGMGGLAAAGVAGLWIGIAPPDLISAEMAMVLGGDTDTLALGLEGEGGFFGEPALAGEGDG